MLRLCVFHTRHAVVVAVGVEISPRGGTLMTGPRVLFVTGKLAEPALRRVLADVAPRAGFEAEVAVLPISVAALLTTDWIARHLTPPADVIRIVLPGFVRGELGDIASAATVERGPKDLRDLPEFFGQQSGPPPDYGAFDTQIIAEIHHAACVPLPE